MKKILFLASLLISVVISTTVVSAIEGEGTAEAPYIITDQGELELVTDFPKSCFILGNDIEIEGILTPLCYETSEQSFYGTFDGNGYTISNLTKNGGYGGLFCCNRGTIKNLKIEIGEDGFVGKSNSVAAVAGLNYGKISNCTVIGDVSNEGNYVGGIAGINYGTISKCIYRGNVTNSFESSTYGLSGGITGSNEEIISECTVIGDITGVGKYVGGIAGINGDGSYARISDSYYKGTLSGGGSSVLGGIAGENRGYSSTDSNKAKIVNCYAVPVFNEGKNKYGISYNFYKDSGGTTYYSGSISLSYYDKTVSKLSATNRGTPKSTAAMKMKATYADGWDFDTVWGIDPKYNGGYPYLLCERPEFEPTPEYSVNSLILKDASENELDAIPESGEFYAEINVTKNGDSKNADSLIIAMFDEDDTLKDVSYMKGTYNQNQNISFGACIKQVDGSIKKIKAFVWDGLEGMTPLSNSAEVN